MHDSYDIADCPSCDQVKPIVERNGLWVCDDCHAELDNPPPDPQPSRNAICPLCDEPGELTRTGICQGCQLIADEATSGLTTYAPEVF